MNALKEAMVNARKFNGQAVKALCFGNTSADMDSVVGSMLMSWLFTSTSKSNLHYSPVILCARSELPWRIEIIQHLACFGMDETWIHQNVFFKDEIDSKLKEIG